MKITGKRSGFKSGRKPKKNYESRLCSAHGCRTTLSIYNNKRFCFLHAPVTYPRLRGHLPKEQNNEWFTKSDK